MGNEGHARDSRPPTPDPQGNLFLTGKSDESLSRVSGRQLGGVGRAGGGRAGRGGWAVRGGGGHEGRMRISYPVTRAILCKILKFGFSHWMMSPSEDLTFPVSSAFCL